MSDGTEGWKKYRVVPETLGLPEIDCESFARRTFTTPKIRTFTTPKFTFPTPKKNHLPGGQLPPPFFFFFFFGALFLAFSTYCSWRTSRIGRRRCLMRWSWRTSSRRCVTRWYGAHQVGGGYHGGHGGRHGGGKVG